MAVEAVPKIASHAAGGRAADGGDLHRSAPEVADGDQVLRAIPASEVYMLLGSRPNGLGADEVSERLTRDGANVLEHVRGPSLVRRLAANFTHFMALLLWAGAGIAFGAHLPQLGVAICLVNVVNGLFSFWQEFKAERATEALLALLPTQAAVIRDDQETRVLAEDLVVGDVVLLGEGDRVSADCSQHRRPARDTRALTEPTSSGRARP